MTLSQFLREFTAERHRAIEDAMPPVPWQRRDAHRLLAGWARALHGYAPLLDGDRSIAAAVGSYRFRQRAVAAALDADALGGNDRTPFVPPGDFSSAACRWGAAYVLEGSALGGLVLAKRLSLLGVTSAFFADSSAVVMGRWQTFRDALDFFGAEAPTTWTQAGDAARATFDTLSVVLTADTVLEPSTSAIPALDPRCGPVIDHR